MKLDIRECTIDDLATLKRVGARHQSYSVISIKSKTAATAVR